MDIIKWRVIHHAGSWATYSSIEAMVAATDAYHRSKGWPGIAYHFVAASEFEEIAWVGDLETVRYHAGGLTTYSAYPNIGANNVEGVGILLWGDYRGVDPDPTFLVRVRRLLDWLEERLPGRALVGHKNLPATNTTCPGDNFEQWRSILN